MKTIADAIAFLTSSRLHATRSGETAARRFAAAGMSEIHPLHAAPGSEPLYARRSACSLAIAFRLFPRGRIFRLLAGSFLCLLFSIGYSRTAEASHYRGASVSYAINANGVVSVTVYSAWRTGSGVTEDTTFSVFSGSAGSGTNYGTMTLAATVNPYSSGTELGGEAFFVKKDVYTMNFTGKAAGAYYAYWTSGSWVGGINNEPQGSWGEEIKIVYTPGVASAGPTMIPATIDIIGRGYNYAQISIAATRTEPP